MGRLIGFREVVLATENVNRLRNPDEILRWVFRIFDASGSGYLETEKVADMTDVILE